MNEVGIRNIFFKSTTWNNWLPWLSADVLLLTVPHRDFSIIYGIYWEYYSIVWGFVWRLGWEKWHLLFSPIVALGWQGVDLALGMDWSHGSLHIVTTVPIKVVCLASSIVQIKHTALPPPCLLVKQISLFSLSKTSYRSSNLQENFILEKKALKRFSSINISAIWALTVSG